MFIVHLFVSYVHVGLCHFFSFSWCRGLAATSACGSSWTFLFTFLFHLYGIDNDEESILNIRLTRLCKIWTSLSWNLVQLYNNFRNYEKCVTFPIEIDCLIQ